MRLTAHTDYALRVMMYLGVREAASEGAYAGTGEGAREARPTIGEIAAAYGISRNHLMKVVHRLGRDGYVETARGKGGGLRLARPATAVRLGTLARAMEAGREPLVECFDRATSTCVISPPCRLRPILAEAEEAFFAALDRHTLADLLGPRRDLAVALGVGVNPW